MHSRYRECMGRRDWTNEVAVAAHFRSEIGQPA
jgi:hypothetical protein